MEMYLDIACIDQEENFSISKLQIDIQLLR